MAKEFDREGLQEFVDKGEKSPPPVFVGREETIEDILKAAKSAYQPSSSTRGEAGITRIIHGAPGAGKSSILAELETQCLALSADAENAPRIVVFNSEYLESNLPFVLAAAWMAGSAPRENWLRMFGTMEEPLKKAGTQLGSVIGKPIKEIGTRLGSVSAFGVSLNLANMFGGKPYADIHDLAKRQPPSEWGHPVIVAVDEAQNLPPDKHSPHGVFLRHVHNAGTGLPLTLVLAGLGDTFERAGEVGLTRGLKLHEIGCLTKEEYRELTRRFCEHYGMSGYTEAQLARLSRPTEGWPRHLHFAFQALGKQALKVDGDLRRIGWDETILEAAEGRLRYYRGQRSNEMKASASLVKAVMTGLKDNMQVEDIDHLIKTSVSDGKGMQLPEVGPEDDRRFMHPGEFRQHLVHQGALELREDGTYHCPIPSNRTFLMMKGDLTAQQLTEAAAERQRTGGHRMNFGIERS